MRDILLRLIMPPRPRRPDSSVLLPASELGYAVVHGDFVRFGCRAAGGLTINTGGRNPEGFKWPAAAPGPGAWTLWGQGRPKRDNRPSWLFDLVADCLDVLGHRLIPFLVRRFNSRPTLMTRWIVLDQWASASISLIRSCSFSFIDKCSERMVVIGSQALDSFKPLVSLICG